MDVYPSFRWHLCGGDHSSTSLFHVETKFFQLRLAVHALCNVTNFISTISQCSGRICEYRSDISAVTFRSQDVTLTQFYGNARWLHSQVFHCYAFRRFEITIYILKIFHKELLWNILFSYFVYCLVQRTLFTILLLNKIPHLKI